MFNAWVEQTIQGAQVNFALNQNDTFNFVFQNLMIGCNPSEPFSLTGYYIKMTINFPTPISYDTVGGGIVIPSAPNDNGFSVNDTAANTTLWVPGRYAYAIWIGSQESPPIGDTYFTGYAIVNARNVSVPS